LYGTALPLKADHFYYPLFHYSNILLFHSVPPLYMIVKKMTDLRALGMREKILVIHQGALGDLVLSFPALVSLKQEKKASVALLCSSELGKIAYELNVVDAHFSLESARFCSLFYGDMTTVVKEFISDYDTIILISFSAAIEAHLRQNHGGKVHKISPRPPVEDETHVARYIIKQLKAKGLLRGGVLSSGDHPVEQRQSLQERNLIIMHPGAGSARKRWPVENFVQVSAITGRMGLGKVVFLVGPAESGLARFIKDRPKEGYRVYEVYDLSDVMALVRQARCFVGNDSGVTHLAAFMGTPTVAIFGPSSAKRWSPLGRAITVLRGAADCAPCFEMDAVSCENPRCLNEVSVGMVLDAVRGITS
jgi:heptosyltransferase-3